MRTVNTAMTTAEASTSVVSVSASRPLRRNVLRKRERDRSRQPAEQPERPVDEPVAEAGRRDARLH